MIVKLITDKGAVSSAVSKKPVVYATTTTGHSRTPPTPYMIGLAIDKAKDLNFAPGCKVRIKTGLQDTIRKVIGFYGDATLSDKGLAAPYYVTQVENLFNVCCIYLEGETKKSVASPYAISELDLVT